MINLKVFTVLIVMVSGFVLSAEARYQEDGVGARSRLLQRVKSSYALKGKSTITMPANINRGSRLAARSAVGGSTSGNRGIVAATRLKLAERSQSSLLLKDRSSTAISTRSHHLGVLRANPNSFRANRGSLSRLR